MPGGSGGLWVPGSVGLHHPADLLDDFRIGEAGDVPDLGSVGDGSEHPHDGSMRRRTIGVVPYHRGIATMESWFTRAGRG